MQQRNNSAVVCFDFTQFTSEILDIEPQIEEVKLMCNTHGKEWGFQLEGALTTGNPHFQGRIKFKEKIRLATLINKIKGFHWSITSKDNINNFDYVTKEQTRLLGPWKWNDKELWIPPQYMIIEKGLLPFQQSISEINSSPPNSREINIIFDPQGGIGKTTYVGYLCCQHKAMQIPYCNDYKELMGIVCCQFEELFDKKDHNIIFVDLPRAIKKDKLPGLYSALETIKNGHASDPRYKYKEVYFATPHLWVFTNVLPNPDYLSIDKWKIWTVDKVHKELHHFDRQAYETAMNDVTEILDSYL